MASPAASGPGARQPIQVFGRPDSAGTRRCRRFFSERRVAVSFVDVSRRPPSPAELRAFLRESLAEQMLPSAFVSLSTLPLTASGKVDRRSLPAPPPPGQETSDPSRRAETALEEFVAATFADILGVPAVGPADDFFVLGGHSLLAMQMISRLEAALDVDVSLQGFFQRPTVEDLCAMLCSNGEVASELEARAAVVMRVADLSDEDVQSMLAERGLAT